MRRSARLVALALALPALLATIVSLPACASSTAPAADVCGEAKNRFSSCGTSLPLLQDGPCSGTTRVIARCVVDHAHDCDELATLLTRIDACVAAMLDGGDSLLPPATDLPVSAIDGGPREAATSDGAAPPRDGGPDATGPIVDAAVDAGPTAWSGLDGAGTVKLNEEMRFQTPTLAAGSYTFAITGTGDADLYVRKTAAPTSALYDCRPFVAASTESCTLTLLSPAIIHVMIRGAATTSTFTLEGRHE